MTKPGNETRGQTGRSPTTLEALVFDFPRILRAFALLQFGPLAEKSWVGLPLRRA